MNPKQMVYLINADFERQREEAWRELHRRPDAEPLPPEPEKQAGIGLGLRLSMVVRGWLLRLADALPHPRDDEASAV